MYKKINLNMAMHMYVCVISMYVCSFIYTCGGGKFTSASHLDTYGSVISSMPFVTKVYASI